MDQKQLAAQYLCPAADSLYLKFVENAEEVMNSSDKDNSFHPEYTHQIFGDSEKIFGFKGLRIELYMTPGGLSTYLGMSYDSKADQSVVKAKADAPLATLAEWLAPEYSTSKEQFITQLEAEASFKPTGELVHRFQIEDSEQKREFEIYFNKSDTPEFEEYLARLQIYLIFYIEGASYLDLSDDRWRVFLLFEKKFVNGSERYFISGLVSVCMFWTYPDKVRPRISQVLILPPYRRRGLGAPLLQAVYDRYLPMDKVVDFPVEDPSEEFTKLRDYVDCLNCLKIPEIKNYNGPCDANYINMVKSKLKLNKMQIRRVYEILQYQKLNKANAEEYLNFRLAVKKRLYQPFAKTKEAEKRDLSKLAPAEQAVWKVQHKQFQESIQEEYQKVEEEYQKVIDRIKIYGPKC